MDFDEVLSLIGELGRYQTWLFVFVCVPASLPAAVTIFSHIFTSDVPEHHCHPILKAEKASLLKARLAPSESYRQALNSLFLPRDAGGKFLSCRQYDVDVNAVIDEVVSHNQYINSTMLDGFVSRKNWPWVQCMNGWDYDTTEYTETLATKYNVVCDDRWLISTGQSAFFVGGVIGSVAFGWISDKWGRRPALFLSTAVMMIGNFAEIYPPNYFAYIIMRFIVGLSYPSVYNLAFLIVAEMIGVTKRMLSSMVCHIAFSLGMMLLAYVAHFIDHWQTLQIATSLPMLLLISYYWSVPESPRWLVSQGRVDEAEIIIQKMAKANGVPLPADFLHNNLVEYFPSNTAGEKEPQKIGFLTLFHYPRIMLRILAVSVVWTITSMVYQGMSLAAPDLPSETYFAFFLSGLFDIPGVLLAWVTMQRFGRKSTMLWTLFLSGVCSAATAAVCEAMPWLAVLFPSLAKLCASATFTVMYIFAGELFPTVIRGFALGMASTMSQLGLVGTPYILSLGNLYGKSAPFVVLGILGGLAAFLMLSLPETLNHPLPTTMHEAECYDRYTKTRTESVRRKSVRASGAVIVTFVSHGSLPS